MLKTLVLQGLGLVFLFSSCIEISLKNEDSRTQEEVEIKTCLIKMWDAIEKEDLDEYARYIHPDFTQFGESDPILKVGKESELSGVKGWLENSSNIHTEMDDPRVTVKNDVAWITYYWRDSGTSNGEQFASKGKSTRIFVREDGKWLCIHGHYTLLPAE